MELINHTNYPTMLFRSIIDNDHLITSVIARVTFDIKDGKAITSPNQEWLLYNEPWESEYGPIQGDRIFRMGGIDLLVYGKARSHTPVKNMEVKIQLEKRFSHSLTVFGNRFWEKNVLGMHISDPEPFTEMPLTLYNAYGGYAEWDGMKLPYGNNTYGKGFYWEREEAVNKQLPNIEDPKNLIYKWDHRPDPVGFVSCPMNELRMRRSVDYTDTYRIKKIGAHFFNTAFPEMVIDGINAGEKISISGMTTEDGFVLEIPSQSLCIKIIIGNKVKERELKIDQVGIVPDKRQAFITYRFPFRYKFEPLQIRRCELFEQI